MDARDPLERFEKLLRKGDRLITDVLDLIEQLREEGRLGELSQKLFGRPTTVRYTSIAPAVAVAAEEMNPRDRGVTQIAFERRGTLVRVVIPGVKPICMRPQRAALLKALAESAGDSKDDFVPFKTPDQLQRRIAQLTGKTLKPHSIASAVSRLRNQSLPPHARGLIETRDSHKTGEITAYRFLLRTGGRIIEHPPDGGADGGAIGAANDGDR
jgi:hypothetical protein